MKQKLRTAASAYFGWNYPINSASLRSEYGEVPAWRILFASRNGYEGVRATPPPPPLPRAVQGNAGSMDCEMCALAWLLLLPLLLALSGRTCQSNRCPGIGFKREMRSKLH